MLLHNHNLNESIGCRWALTYCQNKLILLSRMKDLLFSWDESLAGLLKNEQRITQTVDLHDAQWFNVYLNVIKYRKLKYSILKRIRKFEMKFHFLVTKTDFILNSLTSFWKLQPAWLNVHQEFPFIEHLIVWNSTCKGEELKW